MMRKMVVVIGVLSFSVLLNGMQLVGDRDKKSDEVVIDMNQTGTSKPVTTLDLGSLTTPLARSKSGKQAISSLDHVTHLQRAQSTYREQTTSRRDNENKQRDIRRTPKSFGKSTITTSSGLPTNLDNIQQPIIVDPNQKNIIEHDEHTIEIPMQSATRRSTALHDLPDDARDQSMWALLGKVNPKFYEFAKENFYTLDDVMECKYDFGNINAHVLDFAKKYNVPIDEMMEYQSLLDKFEVEPDGLVALVVKRHDISSYTASVLKDYFKEMQAKKQEAYIPYALDFIGKTCFGGAEKDSSPLNKAVITAQDEKITDQRKQLIGTIIGAIVTGIIAIGQAAWAIYGQAKPIPTFAPTHMPTFAPTFMPTGAPT